MPPLVRPIRRPLPLFHTHAGRCSVGLEVSRVDHGRLLFAVLSRQTGHHPGKDTLVAPTLPTGVQRLVRAVGSGGITPSQPIAVDEDNPAQHTPIIPLGTLLRNALPGNERVACRGDLGKKGSRLAI